MKPSYYLVTALLFGLVTSAYASNREQFRFKKSLETGQAREVKTSIDFLAGELHLNNLTTSLADCYYGKGTQYLRPELVYHEVGKTGYLRVESQKNEKRRIDDVNDNEWRLSIHPDVTNSIAIRLKAGKAHINLEDSKLKRFEYKMMAGESNINLRNTSVPELTFSMMAGEANLDLSGRWHNDLEATIKGGVGELNIKVPYDVGVRVYVSGLIGDVNIPFFKRSGKTYTNDAYGRSKHTLFITIEAGIGEVNVEMVE